MGILISVLERGNSHPMGWGPELLGCLQTAPVSCPDAPSAWFRDPARCLGLGVPEVQSVAPPTVAT